MERGVPDRRPGAPRRAHSARPGPGQSRRPGEAAVAGRISRALSEALPLALRDAGAVPGPGLEHGGRVPDAQPDAPVARISRQDRAGGLRRRPHPLAAGKAQARRHPAGGQRAGDLGADPELFRARQRRAGGLSARHALRRPARGAPARGVPAELRLQPPHRRARSRRRRRLLRAVRRAGDLRPDPARLAADRADENRLDVLVLSLRRHGLGAHLSAPPGRPAAALRHQAAPGPVRGRRHPRGIQPARGAAGAAQALQPRSRRGSREPQDAAGDYAVNKMTELSKAPPAPMTEAELRKRLGPYVAPAGLYKLNKARPFAGNVRCNVERLVAGSWNEIVLDYEVGASGIADRAWFKATFKFYSDWALFQTADPQGANYVSADYQAGALVEGQSPAAVQSLKVRFDQKGHERPFQKAIIVDTVDGDLNAGDHIIVRLGDRRMGGPGTRVQTFAEDKFRFRCYVDPLGTSRFVAVPGDIVIDIVPGAAASLALVGPRLVLPKTPFTLRVNAHDRWGNACAESGGEVEVTATREGKTVYEKTIQLNPKGWATAGIKDLPREAAELIVTARMTGPGAGLGEIAEAVHFVTIDESAPCARVFYGDLHIHAHDTVGTNSPAYNTAYGRDIAGLDVVSYTANDFQITDANWALGVKTMDEFHKDGELVCFPVQEWCGSSTAGGDHNVVFLHGKTPEFPYNANGEHNRTFTWNEDMKGTGVDLGRWPIEELWLAYSHDPENHLIMPHVGGRRYIPDWHHPGLERLIEISSSWGHFGWLYQDVIERGYKLGASASGDEHRGRPR